MNIHFPLRALLLIALLVGLSSQARSQSCGLGEIALGDVYLSFSDDSYERYAIDVPALTPFNFYLVTDIDYCDCGNCGLNFNQGIRAWEAQVDPSRAPDITIVSTVLTPATSVNFGSPANTNFLVGTGGVCFTGNEQPGDLVEFTAILTNNLGAEDQRLDIVPATPPTRFSPAWNQCGPSDGILYAYYARADAMGRGYEEGYIIINPSIPTRTANWGGLKAVFGNP